MKFKADGTSMKLGLDKWQKALVGPLTAEHISVIALADVQRNFQTSGGNIDKQWKPLSEATMIIRANSKPPRSGSSKPLVGRDNRMMTSIHSKVSPGIVEIGSDMTTKKGLSIHKIHDEGASWTPSAKQKAFLRYRGIIIGNNITIPAREFAELSNGAVKEIETVVPKKLEKQV